MTVTTMYECPNCHGWGHLKITSERDNVQKLKCVPMYTFATTCGHRFERKSYPSVDAKVLTDLDSEDG